MRCAIGVFGACVFSASLAHAQWGDLKGRILLNGDVPPRKMLVQKGDKTAKDAEVSAKEGVPDESLLIDAESKGIANVGVWLMKKPMKIHPELMNAELPLVTMDMTGTRFNPHLSVLRTNQTLTFVNRDGVQYNPRATPLKNAQFGAIVGGPLNFKHAERRPVPIGCDIHLWMRAYVIVVDHPYATVTDKDGNFEIKDLPTGEHEFKVWHENSGYLVKDKQDPKKGLIVTIKDGETLALPDTIVPFEKVQPD